MADNKYGKLYTVDDVLSIVETCLETGIEDEGEALEIINNHVGKFSGDMPVFVMSAKDRRALGAIRHYRDNQSPGAPSGHLASIDRAIADFEKWRNNNPDKMRNPD